MKFLKITFFPAILFFLSMSYTSLSSTIIRNDFKKYYDKYGVDGSFVMYDQKNNRYTIYNQDQRSKPFTPASTFKICNSLVSLETGVVKDENVIF